MATHMLLKTHFKLFSSSSFPEYFLKEKVAKKGIIKTSDQRHARRETFSRFQKKKKKNK